MHLLRMQMSCEQVQAAEELQRRLQHLEGEWKHRHEFELAERSRAAADSLATALSELASQHAADMAAAIARLQSECASSPLRHAAAVCHGTACA